MLRVLLNAWREERSMWHAQRHLFRAGRLHKNGQHEAAIEHALAARKLEPDFACYWGILTEALIELGRYEEAQRYLEEDLARDPSDPDWNRQLIRVMLAADAPPLEYRQYVEAFWENRDRLIKYGTSRLERWFYSLRGTREEHETFFREHEAYNAAWERWTRQMMQYYRDIAD